MDNARSRLENLLSYKDEDLRPWLGGRHIPNHYKRITVSAQEHQRLAVIGAKELFTAYEIIPYYTQAVITGALLCGDYDRLTIVTPFQYGKSFTMGHAALLMARKGTNVYVGGNTSDIASIIMTNTYAAVRHASPEMKSELTGDWMKRVDKMGAALSRDNIVFSHGGSVSAVTLGGTYEDLAHNKAVGHGGAYILDEAALIPDAVYRETLRAEFNRTDGKRSVMAAISNPHCSGWFYNDLVKERPDDRHLIIWMDALTAVQEDRWTAEHILASEASKHQDDIERYLLCELPGSGHGMYPEPKVEEKTGYIHFFGVDAAYKGKDKIMVCDAVLSDTLHINEIAELEKTDWIDGVTSEQICDDIARVYHRYESAMVCVDVGFGVWLTEGLAHRGVNVKGINFGSGATPERIRARHYAATNAYNMRAEMHIDVQDLMDGGKLTFSHQAYEKVKETIPHITSERMANGKIRVRPKLEIKHAIGHSPDAWDAVVLAVHAWVIYQGNASEFITE